MAKKIKRESRGRKKRERDRGRDKGREREGERQRGRERERKGCITHQKGLIQYLLVFYLFSLSLSILSSLSSFVSFSFMAEEEERRPSAVQRPQPERWWSQ